MTKRALTGEGEDRVILDAPTTRDRCHGHTMAVKLARKSGGGQAHGAQRK